MTTAMDDAVETVVTGYVGAGLWDDTVLVFSTDNVSNLCIVLTPKIRVSRTYLCGRIAVLNPLCVGAGRTSRFGGRP